VIGMQREMKSGDKQPLRLYAYDRDGAAVEIPNDAVKWTILSGQTYAELTVGELKGLRQGQAVVEASFRANEQYAWTDYGVFDIDQISTVPMTDLEAVTADLAALAIRYTEGDDPTSVTKTVYLPVEGANGSTIEWSSSRPTAIDAATGQVTRPAFGAGDAAATLTATVVKGDVRQTKAFQLNVKQLEQTNGGGHPGGNGSGGGDGDGGDGGDGPGGNAGGSGTSDGGGNSAPTQPSTDAGWRIDPASGGTVSGDGVAIQFPAGSFPGTFRVSIGAMSEDEVKRLPAGERRVSQIYEITKSATGIFLKPVTLTLPFDRDRLDSAADTVAVYWYNEVTGEWVPLDGATIDWANGTVSGQTIHFTKFAVLTPPGKAPSGSGEPLPTFADIAGHWAEASIRAMAGRGGIDGYPDGTFRPDREVTRAEFVQLLVRTVGIAGKGVAGRTFADTANHWAHDAIAAAAANSIVDGYDERTFGPDDPITRQQMAALLVRALKLPAARSAASFVDSGDISAWALPAVTAAAERGLIDGYEDGTFRPLARATRAETVAVLTRASAFE